PWAVQLPAHRMPDNEHALGAIEGGAVLVPLLHVGRPDALLVNELLPASRFAFNSILEDRVLRIGELLVIVEEILASQAGDALWVRGDSQSPQRDIDVVNAIVADVATAKVIPPSPDARQQIGAVGNGWRRT